MADVVHERLVQWPEKKRELWEAVRARGAKKKAPKFVVEGQQPSLERQVVKALRMGDVRKALQLFTAAPIAPKTEETFQALQALHPAPKSPILPPPVPVSDAPFFSDKLVREALATFSPCSAAGVRGQNHFTLFPHSLVP
jgi:hypothetical protein